MKEKKVNIESTEPINSIAEVDSVVDAFVKRGGYITHEEDLKIRKRITSRNHLSLWINSVKNKLIYKKEKIVKHISGARVKLKKIHSSMNVSSPQTKPLVKDKREDKVVVKRSLIIDNYSDIYKDDSTLRPYQQKAKKEIFESWDEIDNVMFQMPTGTGKTRLFTSIIRDINDYSLKRKEPVKILIVAHRTELIDQIDESLDKYHVPHSVIAGSKKRDYKKPVIVASIQTITHPKNLKDAEKLNVRFVIIDEAHHALATTYKKLWDLYPGSKKLGVTATPWRMNHQSFTDLFDKLVLSMPIKDFIKQGYLAPYKYFSLRSDSDILNTIDDIELDKFGEYMDSSMEEKMDIGRIRAQLLQSYLALAEGKKGIIYAINIVHARHVSKEYQDAGYKVVCIDNNTSDAERKDFVKKFRKGEIDIIVNVDIFSEGFDCPDIEFIQLARPTRSLVKYLQQVGRGLRITGNKTECIILDNVGMYSRFGLPDARRHWKYHFLGHDVEDEEEPRKEMSKGTGRTRYVDMSEGTEDMELIQDVHDEVEVIEKQPDSLERSSSAINDFFPLFGITLGKTTWKQVKEMGYKVEKWEDGPARYTTVEGVAFWDHDGERKFTSMYWVQDEIDFPPLWKSKGFSWNLSFDEWWVVFERLGYKIKVDKQPIQKKYKGRDTLCAEFEALSPDGLLTFDLDFNYGEDGYYTSSPNTLYAISVDYNGLPIDIKTPNDMGETKEEINQEVVKIEDEPNVVDAFDPIPKLLENNYENDNFVFWSDDNKKIYEAYIQDDTYYIISELIIDETQHCVHRNRVGKIPMDSWMFWQMEREKVDNLYSIKHLGANYTIFHFEVSDKDNTTKDKYFDYKGREIESPSDVEAKYRKKTIEGQLQDYIDVPVSKAIFWTEILRKSLNISITRTIKGVTKIIALIPLQSDFGRKYYDLSNVRIQTWKKKKINQNDYNTLKNYKSDTCYIYRSDYKSITLKCYEEDKTYLYNYDLKGNLIKKGTIAIREKVKSYPLTDSDIDKLWHAFDKKATSYKYFWFLSILQNYKETKKETIPFKDILIKMASCAWKYVFTENGIFPQLDQLPNYLMTIKDSLRLDKSSNNKDIEIKADRYYEVLEVGKTLTPLLNNVPYRFLSPWIPYTDNDDVIAKSNNPDLKCPYGLHDDHITINPIWGDYLIDNYDKIVQFIDEELRVYLKCNRVVKAMTVTEFTRICRELQGRYREKMSEPMGYGPGALSPNKQINMLVNGEKTGKNFVNEFTFNYAKQRVKNLQAHETINSYRLFNNMLSSQPMAFNLFCPFIQMLEEGKAKAVTKIFKAIFPDKYIGEVTEVALEYLHKDIKNYLNDCTAMDAIIRYKDAWGKSAFIAIETKYTDTLGENTSNKDRAQDKYREWIKRIKMFEPETEKELLSGNKVITQIYRNFLLTECYGIVEGAGRCYSVVLAPAQHPTTEKEVASLRNELLPEYKFKISAISLEDFIKITLRTCPKEDKSPFLYFKERYIPKI